MDLLDQLHRRLRAAAEDGASYTVADLYQQLVPYRAVRAEIGVFELAQYEHALLRLLAGERGYVELEDEAARAEIARELESPNPILGIYRDYAGTGMRLGGDDRLEPPVEAPPLPEIVETPRARVAVPPASPRCRSCRAELPRVADLRYCPDCGTDQREVPCEGCGSPLKEEWNFCIRCGRRRGDRPVPA
ncbi:MAG TPA: zinc ribbon domain-containing protein [Longimicrobiaceae bacterium]|nr:zinc ribbon domain-containing protein [Longimicrobiaceae bacterium]